MTSVSYPIPLKKGDKIAITAPSSGVPALLHERLDKVLGHLKEQGFEVVEGRCLRDNHHHVSADAQTRADELMTFLTDDAIAAVMPPWGGEFAMDILPLLDYERLQQAKPKWICGYSDTSTLLTAITTLSGWATAHSITLMERHKGQKDKLSQGFMRVLSLKEGESFLQSASDYYQVQGASFSENPDAVFNLTEKTEWKQTGTYSARHLRGRLIGGCFDTMTHLISTPYFDLDRFCQEHNDTGVILYLENAEMSPTVLKRALMSLKYKGVFDRINGLLLGRNAVEGDASKDITGEQAMLDVLSDVQIPVLYDMDIGHLPPNLTLVNGAFAEVDSEEKTITQIFQ